MQIIGLPPGVQDIVVIFVLALAGRQALTRELRPNRQPTMLIPPCSQATGRHDTAMKALVKPGGCGRVIIPVNNMTIGTAIVGNREQA